MFLILLYLACAHLRGISVEKEEGGEGEEGGQAWQGDGEVRTPEETIVDLHIRVFAPSCICILGRPCMQQKVVRALGSCVQHVKSCSENSNCS